MGIKNELDVEIAMVRAKIAGLAPEANAIETANGTSNTVAPTFDMIRVKAVAITASTACNPQIGHPSNKSKIF